MEAFPQAIRELAIDEDVTEEKAISICSWFMDHRDLFSGGGGRQASHKEAVAEVKKMRDLHERGLFNLRRYIKNGGDPILGLSCICLPLKFYTAAGGVDTLAKLVALFGGKKQKQRVNKCLQFFQEQMPELPKLTEQRKDESCENMAAAARSRAVGTPQ